jgi:hypothetical protein
MDETLTPEQWFELKCRIKKQYPELTDADLQYHEAVEQDMLSMVACRLQKIKEIMHGIHERQSRNSPLRKFWKYSRKSHTLQNV